MKTEKLGEDTDIIISGFSNTHGDVDMQGDSEAVLDEDDPVQSKNETHFLKLIRELWSENLCSFKDSVEDAETQFYTKLLDVLKLYYVSFQPLINICMSHRINENFSCN